MIDLIKFVLPIAATLVVAAMAQPWFGDRRRHAIERDLALLEKLKPSASPGGAAVESALRTSIDVQIAGLLIAKNPMPKASEAATAIVAVISGGVLMNLGANSDGVVLWLLVCIGCAFYLFGAALLVTLYWDWIRSRRLAKARALFGIPNPLQDLDANHRGIAGSQ